MAQAESKTNCHHCQSDTSDATSAAPMSGEAHLSLCKGKQIPHSTHKEKRNAKSPPLQHIVPTGSPENLHALLGACCSPSTSHSSPDRGTTRPRKNDTSKPPYTSPPRAKEHNMKFTRLLYEEKSRARSMAHLYLGRSICCPSLTSPGHPRAPERVIFLPNKVLPKLVADFS